MDNADFWIKAFGVIAAVAVAMTAIVKYLHERFSRKKENSTRRQHVVAGRDANVINDSFNIKREK